MITYSLAPSPKWYFLDTFGVPAAGGTLTTWESDDHSTPKFVFSDPAGLFPYTDPIILDASGGTPVPIYWQFNGTDLYYIQVKDASGNLIFDLDNFPIIGGGGGTPINNNVDIQNHLINGSFLFIDADITADSLISPIPTMAPIRIAPAAGFFKSLTGAYLPNIPNNMSGWLYQASGGAGSTSSIQFVDVTNIGEGFPNAPSANATRFFRYQLSATGTIQTAQNLYQVIPDVETFSGEVLTITLDIHSNAVGNASATILQNFGSGGTPSTPVSTSQSFMFTGGGTWSRITLSITVPTVNGKIKGTNGDSSLNVVFNFPLNTLGTFDITNLQLQRGSFGLIPYIYQTYNQDQYKVLIDLLTFGNAIYQTGDYIWSDNGSVSAPTGRLGWLLLYNNAQSIGSATSGATATGNIYKSLYLLWWTIYPQSECVVAGGRGTTALADFTANKAMSIPQHLVNYTFASVGNSISFPFFEGSPTALIGIPNLPAHTHTYDLVTPGSGTASGTFNPGIASITGAQTGSAGGNVPLSVMQPTVYKYLFVKL